jgi:hypothetical protein
MLLELQLNGEVLGIYHEGSRVEFPDGDAVSPAHVGPVFGKDYVFVEHIVPPPPEPTEEELRAAMRPLSARQLRLALLSINLQEADIDMMLVNDPAGMVEWKYASYYTRTHVLIETLGAAHSLTPTQIDSLWNWASEL